MVKFLAGGVDYVKRVIGSGFSSPFPIVENCLRAMEGIEHRMVEVNGIKMHIAEKGEGPTVLLLHGFPELWYSWRHQIIFLASKGYKAVAPDMRGYGGTDAPSSFHSYTCLHIVGDLIALIDLLGADQVFVVGHDWGASMAWQLCLFRPDRVKALVNLCVPFFPRDPSMKTTVALKHFFSDDFYISRFLEPGEMEAECARAGTDRVIRKLLTLFSESSTPLIPKETGFGVEPITLPSWLSEEDVSYFVQNFEKSGFTGGFNYYRAMDLTWEMTAPWTNAQVKVPTKFVVGDMDTTYNFPMQKEYIHSESFKENVPFLQELVVMKGVAHFIQQECPDEISKHIVDFIQKF